MLVSLSVCCLVRASTLVTDYFYMFAYGCQFSLTCETEFFPKDKTSNVDKHLTSFEEVIIHSISAVEFECAIFSFVTGFL